MEEKQTQVDEIVHLARLALAGRSQDVLLFLRRMTKRCRTERPELAAQLAELLRTNPTRQTPLRREATAASPAPVDLDSRLQLVRHEEPVQLEVEPIWAKQVKALLAQVISERERETELHHAGISPTRTILFTGAPGVGKSLGARWLARELKRPLLTLDLSAVMSSFLGRTGTNLRYVLDYAKSVDCVLLLDELDAVAKRRDDATEIGELKRLVTVLLQEIDDWPPTGLLVAATNHPDLLDPAVWRRFEMRVEFPMPSADQVRQAIDTFLGAPKDRSRAWHDAVALTLQGLSFSEVERELMQARREAIIRQQPLEERLTTLVQSRVGPLPRKERGRIALSLTEAGLSQRQVHDVTGVSRDTIRKAARRQAEQKPEEC
ncbi:MAG: AAA family ATPase [Planctomycetes bacterium]|nr:AAA family ATPase [Planctomycetota bacterium]